MPTYEFRCPRGHEFEKFYRTISSAEAQAACPECGEPAERILSPAGFAFKGSGFYLTDYGKNAHREKGPASKSPTSAASSSDADPSSTRSDAKSDSAKSGERSDASTSAAPAPAPAAESKPAPKKSTGE